MGEHPAASAGAAGEAGPDAAPASRRALPDYLPARMLNEYVYCPRLFFYEWVEGVFAHSSDTIAGALRHEKLEWRADPLPPPTTGDEGAPRRARSVELSSERHRLIAIIDLVEASGSAAVPVDYKKGRPRESDCGPEAWPADRAQVCAQALVLRENGYRCDEAILYYSETKQRVRVTIDAALVAETETAIAAAWATATRGRLPPPLIDSPKCPRCSLVGICLPDETALSMRWRDSDGPSAQLSLFGEDACDAPAPPGPATEPLRRLLPARDDLRPLYVTGHGLSIGKTGEVLQIKESRKGTRAARLVQEARLNEISQVNVFGNVQVTAAAIQGLCWAEKPLAHFSFGGWFYGLTQGLGLKNVFLRREQFRRGADPHFCLRVAREIVASARCCSAITSSRPRWCSCACAAWRSRHRRRRISTSCSASRAARRASTSSTSRG